MKKQQKLLYVWDMLRGILGRSRATWLGIGVNVLFIVVSSKFHMKFQESIADVAKYIVGLGPQDGEHGRRIFALFLIHPLFHYMSSLVQKVVLAFVLQSLLAESFRQCLEEYISISHNDFHHLGSGQIHSLVERRTNGILKLVETLFADVLFPLFFIAQGIGYFSRCSVSVLALTVVQIVVYGGVSWYGAVVRNRFRKRYNKSYNLASNKLYGILQNYDIIRTYNRGEEELGRYRKSLDAVGRDSRIYGQIGSFIEFFQKGLFFLPNAFLIFSVMNGYCFTDLRGSEYMSYGRFFSELRTQVMNLKSSLFVMNENLTDILDSRIENAEQDDEGGVSVQTLRQGIRIENMSVCVGGRVLVRDFSVDVKRGEKIGIIGKNGCGKTSFINVLLRFLEYEGRVFVDDCELREIRKSAMRDLISFVPQSHYLFDGTVMENLGYALDRVDEEWIVKKCKQFNSHEMFQMLENGYQTNVGEGGQFLSGGQKQRVGFVRAMVKDADIVLLDEPTSNLDANAEKEFVEMIFSRMQEKTMFLVVHDHELLRGFDKILGFCDGTVTVYESFDRFIADRTRY